MSARCCRQALHHARRHKGGRGLKRITKPLHIELEYSNTVKAATEREWLPGRSFEAGSSSSQASRRISPGTDARVAWTTVQPSSSMVVVDFTVTRAVRVAEPLGPALRQEKGRMCT